MEATIEKVGFQTYSAYKDSGVEWLGEIPEHWEISPGFTFLYESSEKNTGMKRSTVLSLSYGNIRVKGKDELTGLVPESFETYQLVNCGDIIFRPTDLQNDKTSLRTGISDFNGIITSAYINLRIKEIANKRFYSYFFRSIDHNKVIYGLGSGLRQNISFRDFRRFPFPFPPLAEQTAIANFLDKKTALIDQAIQIKEKQIALLKERRQILIHQAVTRGLDPTVKLKDSGVEWIGMIPEGWEVKPLKYISEVQSGVTLGKTYNIKKLPSFPYLRVANIQSGYFKLDEIAEINLPENVASKYFVRPGDILVTEGGDLDKLGRGTVWKGEIKNCLHQNHVFAIRIINPITSSEYTSMLMESDYGRKYFTTTANKTTNLASTNSTKLGNFPLILPPQSEQVAILTYVTNMTTKTSKSLNIKEKEIEKLKEYKATLINSAVTGKIKVG